MSTGINYLDENWGVITGCSHAGSPGCDHCYARMSHERRHKAFLAGKKMPKQYAMPFNVLQFHEDRLNKPLHWRKPRDIGVVLGGDWMHPDVTDNQIVAMLNVMSSGFCAHHTFLTLTKRPARLATLPGGAYQANTFNGATCCTQPELDRNAPELLKVPGKLWLSFEPLLSAIDAHDVLATGRILLVVVGCESGPGRRYVSIANILDIVEQCRAANVLCFVKQVPVPHPNTLAIWRTSISREPATRGPATRCHRTGCITKPRPLNLPTGRARSNWRREKE